jgi:DNA-binding beta-propeller fold protein YncE
MFLVILFAISISAYSQDTYQFVLKWGSFGTGDGQFREPNGVAVDSSGNVYVNDWINHRISKFDSEGTFLTQWGEEGTGGGQFLGPWDAAVDSSGNVYVADTGNFRIQKFAAYLPVDIDIKPGGYPKSINLGEHGLLPIAILGSEDFDVGDIDSATVEIGGITLAERGSAKAPKLAFSFEDVNSDGYLDIMTFFEVQTLVIEGILTETTTELVINASLTDGRLIEGTDSVNIVNY